MVSKSKNSSVNEQIKENLRRVYQEALDEEIPSDLAEMINRLAAAKDSKPNDN